MKLFRDKNRGPKVKSEDVVIPEEYLEYEREAEARKRQEAAYTASADSGDDDAADPFAIRVEELLNTSKETLQVQKTEQETPRPDVTVGEIVETLEDLLPDEDTEESTASGETMSLEEALRAEKLRANRAAKAARKKNRKKPKTQLAAEPAEEPEAPAEKRRKPKENDLPTAFKVFLVAIVLAVAAVVVLLGPLMKIDQVRVNDLQNMSAGQVEEIAGNPVGQNLFLYRTGQAEEELRYYPYVKDVQITRHFPHWIDINITEREPAGVLLNNGNYLQFSMDGVLLDNTQTLTNQSLPLITGFSMDEVPAPGEAFKDNARFSDILAIVNACPDDLLTMLQEINIKDRNNILAYTSQGIEVRIGNVENIESRMAALDDIMNQVILSGIIEEPIEAIDIRYEKAPVVVLEGYDNVDVSEYLEDDDANDDENQNNTTATAAGNADNEDTTNTATLSDGDGTTASDQTTAANAVTNDGNNAGTDLTGTTE